MKMRKHEWNDHVDVMAKGEMAKNLRTEDTTGKTFYGWPFNVGFHRQQRQTNKKNSPK